MAQAARFLAAKLNRALGLVKVMIPLGGLSEPNCEGGQFYDPEADLLFVRALEDNLRARVEVIKLDHHMNDDAFIERAAGELRGMLPIGNREEERSEI